MTPDLNSVPSPANQQPSRLSSASASRRPSQALQNPSMTSQDALGLPIRHPRPLTPAEMYMELEKEQEAVVNRLTRELTVLRAQRSASVASNASQSSAASNQSLLPVDPNDANPNHHITGPTHPTRSRRHRSSSSVSARSMTSASHTSTIIPHPTTGPSQVTAILAQAPLGGGVSQASADRAAAVGAPPSRNPSFSGPSGTSTPARQISNEHGSTTSSMSINNLLIRPPPYHASSNMSISNVSTCPVAGSMAPSPAAPGTPLSGQSPSLALPMASFQGRESDHKARVELERVKLENHELRQRIRELERALAARPGTQGSDAQPVGRETSDTRSAGAGPAVSTTTKAVGQVARPGSATGNTTQAPGGVGVSAWAAGTSGASVAGPRERERERERERSESQSTTASSRRGLPAEDRDDVVRVGESAGNAGLR